jgi:hypothetical protein
MNLLIEEQKEKVEEENEIKEEGVPVYVVQIYHLL